MSAGAAAGADPNPPLTFRLELARRLRPLALLLVIVATLGSPLAAFVVGVREIRARGEAMATEIAGLLRPDVLRRPTLWRYDSYKLLDRLSRYQSQLDVDCVAILDVDERLVEQAGTGPNCVGDTAGVVWESARFSAGLSAATAEGQVWVGMSWRRAAVAAAWLAVPGFLVGGLLALLLVRISIGTAARAENSIRILLARLERSRAELARYSRGLEQEVQARVRDLSRALADLDEKSAHLQDISARAQELQEAERRAIGRELHDSVGQALTAVRLNLQLITDHGTLPAAARRIAEQALETTDGALAEVRRAVARLGPAVLAELGLAGAIERLAQDAAEQGGLSATVAVSPHRLPAVVEHACYRIAQEAVTNVIRHAEAKSLAIRVDVAGGRLSLRVADTGRGIGDREPAPDCRGIAGMRERAELLGGRFQVEALPGGGTLVAVDIPLDRRWEDA